MDADSFLCTTTFDMLRGKTLTDIQVNEDKDQIQFIADSGMVFTMLHYKDCCESVYIESIVGNLSDAIGSPILTAEVEVNNPNNYTEWTFYKLATIKGYVTIRWVGEDNGYYSLSVSFELNTLGDEAADMLFDEAKELRHSIQRLRKLFIPKNYSLESFILTYNLIKQALRLYTYLKNKYGISPFDEDDIEFYSLADKIWEEAQAQKEKDIRKIEEERYYRDMAEYELQLKAYNEQNSGRSNMGFVFASLTSSSPGQFLFKPYKPIKPHWMRDKDD